MNKTDELIILLVILVVIVILVNMLFLQSGALAWAGGPRGIQPMLGDCYGGFVSGTPNATQIKNAHPCIAEKTAYAVQMTPPAWWPFPVHPISTATP